jgi:flagellar basal body-associated protein FliL
VKTERGGSSPVSAAIYGILLAVTALLIGVLIFGTVLGLARKAHPAAPAPAAAGAEGPAYFTGIGKIRAATSDKKPATVVVSIAFPYDRGDTAFGEELAAKTKEFREIARGFFSSRSAAELRAATDAELKGEVLKRFNAVLRLGKIDALFFNDYLLID